MSTETDLNAKNPVVRGPVSTKEYVHKDGKRFRVAAVLALALGAVAAAAVISDVAGVFSSIPEDAVRLAPLLILSIALAMGPLVASLGKRVSEHARDVTLMYAHMSILLLVLIVFPAADAGVATIPGVLSFGLHFQIDMLSWIMLLITSTLWLSVGIYARDYMPVEHHRDRFYLFLSVTYTGVLGMVMAADILTMFLFFELMTLASYLLVAHKENTDSIVAGNRYLFMGIAGGLSVLLGIILMQFYTDHLDFALLAGDLRDAGSIQYVIAGVLILGFGLKAGMLPLHIWLPRAHPVAPTPASALLSGLLIKTGTYGILRVVTSFFMPDFEAATNGGDALWALSHNEGSVLIWTGIATMAVGVFLALQQSDLKKMLAYHSISQMGYIIMGIGVASYLGYIGAMGFTGSVFHTVNHALFKSLLFMSVGVVYLSTGRTDMYKLGGLWRHMPVTAALSLVAALGITGMPGFNGFASKTILHHAIDEAWQYGHYSFRSAEMLFTLVSAGTVTSFLKMYYYTFIRKPMPKQDPFVGNSGHGTMQIAMSLLAIPIVAIGVAPGFVIEKMLIPAARAFNYDPEFISSYLVDINVFSSPDLWNTLVVFILGTAMFATGIRFGLFHLHLPKWLNLENTVYNPLIAGTRKLADYLRDRWEQRTNSSDAQIYTLFIVVSLVAILLGSI